MQLDLQALETSFDLVASDGDALMDSFYARLFATAPEVKPLFARTDLRRQKAMLLSALVLLRKSLRDLDAIVPTLRELGARHVAYGARTCPLSGRGRGPHRRDGRRGGRRVASRVRAGLGRGVRRRRRRHARGRLRLIARPRSLSRDSRWSPVDSRHVGASDRHAGPACGAGRDDLARDRPGHGPADGARDAPVADRAAARRAARSRRGERAVVYYVGLLALGRMPHRRLRAGEVVRRRHGAQGATSGAWTWPALAARAFMLRHVGRRPAGWRSARASGVGVRRRRAPRGQRR